MRWAITLIAGCSFTGPAPAGEPDSPAAPVDAGADASPPEPFHLRVSADIDGRSQLVFRDRSVHWVHFQFAAPGREQGDDIATTLDATPWFPAWPDVPTAENRDCNGCMSSSFDELPVALPAVPSEITLARVTGNRDASVIQAPGPDNQHTLIVELSDVGFSGSAIYTIDIDVTPL